MLSVNVVSIVLFVVYQGTNVRERSKPMLLQSVGQPLWV